jgi:hypothetical protein
MEGYSGLNDGKNESLSEDNSPITIAYSAASSAFIQPALQNNGGGFPIH